MKIFVFFSFAGFLCLSCLSVFGSYQNQAVSGSGTTLSIRTQQQYEFTRLDITDGLSSNQVECIFKDSRGFVWIGTNAGLNRYDGVSFKIYKYLKNDSQTPLFDLASGIQEDINGNLWIQSYS